MAVEPVRKAEGQSVVGHQAVGTVMTLQLLKQEALLTAVTAGCEHPESHSQYCDNKENPKSVHQ